MRLNRLFVSTILLMPVLALAACSSDPKTPTRDDASPQVKADTTDLAGGRTFVVFGDFLIDTHLEGASVDSLTLIKPTSPTKGKTHTMKTTDMLPDWAPEGDPVSLFQLGPDDARYVVAGMNVDKTTEGVSQTTTTTLNVGWTDLDGKNHSDGPAEFDGPLEPLSGTSDDILVAAKPGKDGSDDNLVGLNVKTGEEAWELGNVTVLARYFDTAVVAVGNPMCVQQVDRVNLLNGATTNMRKSDNCIEYAFAGEAGTGFDGHFGVGDELPTFSRFGIFDIGSMSSSDGDQAVDLMPATMYDFGNDFSTFKFKDHFKPDGSSILGDKYISDQFRHDPFSPLMVQSSSEGIRVYDTTTGKLVRTIKDPVSSDPMWGKLFFEDTDGGYWSAFDIKSGEETTGYSAQPVSLVGPVMLDDDGNLVTQE